MDNDEYLGIFKILCYIFSIGFLLAGLIDIWTRTSFELSMIIGLLFLIIGNQCESMKENL